ncbi:MAG: hypothetical protein OXN16_13300 [Gammaproteobacteria bacterium]|nr:hypothetical protein [Gammaproteobacteria bacterium]
MKSIDKYVLVLVATLALLLAGCGGGSSTPAGPTEEELAAMRAMEMRAAEQRTALEEAHTALEAALGTLVGTNTQEQIDAASAAHQDLVDAIAAAADVSDTSMYQAAADAAMSTISTAQTRYDERVAAEMAEAERIAAEEAARKAAEEAAAMAATAAKLIAGIYTPAANNTGTAVGDVHAAYNDAGTPTDSTADSHIIVTTGVGTTANGQALSEDKDTTVAALNGWQGKRYAASGTGVDGTYEAYVYSNVGMPTQGKKFGSADAVTADGDFQYQLTDGATAVDTSGAGVPARVALTGVTRTAGTETFNLPDPNPGGATIINVPGSFHGVSGTYRCTPTTPADGCSAQVAARGFTLVGGTWAFAPADPNARVTDMPDTSYASFGWWLHTAADGDLTASAFVDRKGAADAAENLDTLNGTATYRGGAVGKYALSSTTGGTNDAGHFSARATLEANFTDNEITGTVDQFMGGDGESRDWSVALMKSSISAAGVIAGDPDDSTDTGPQMTQWTIGGTAADASGNWTGSLQENGDDGVPGIATGTFYTEYGTAGRMVGAFGANEE